MKRLAGLAVMGALVCVPSAQAAPGLPVPDARVSMSPCPFAGIDQARHPGCYDPGTDTVYVDPTFIGYRFVLWHERGHAFDAERLDPGERNAFSRRVRLSGRPWFGATGTQSPGELFADAYATCALHERPVNGTWTVTYGYAPRDNADHARTCAFIRRSADPTNL